MPDHARTPAEHRRHAERFAAQAYEAPGGVDGLGPSYAMLALTHAMLATHPLDTAPAQTRSARHSGAETWAAALVVIALIAGAVWLILGLLG